MLKLPRSLETDPAHAAVEQALQRDVRVLWSGGKVAVPHVAYTPALEVALSNAQREKVLQRGLEHVDDVLDRESRGLVALREKQGGPAANRISRLLLCTDDGAERLYRQIDATLGRHADRLLGLRLDVPGPRLAVPVFGAEVVVKVILVSDRNAVAAVLRSLAPA